MENVIDRDEEQKQIKAVYAIFGQQGGTIHQLVAAINKLYSQCLKTSDIESYLFDIMEEKNKNIFILKCHSLECMLRIQKYKNS